MVETKKKKNIYIYIYIYRNSKESPQREKEAYWE